MNRRIWKLFASLALMLVMVGSAIFATGCYIIKGVSMKDLVGTYELTHYSTKTDAKTEREIVLYMVIKSDGTGYYVFKDNDTPLYASEMKFRFETSAEDSSKYEYVYAKFNTKSEEVKFGINGKNLNYEKIVWKQITLDNFALKEDYRINVDFNKVSDKTDLSYANHHLGANLSAMPYGLANLNGLYFCNGPRLDYSYLSASDLLVYKQEMPLYVYASLDVFHNKAKFYYMYASEKRALTKEFDVTITPLDTMGSFSIATEVGSINITNSGGYSTQVAINQAVQDAEGNTQMLAWEFYYYADLNYDVTEMTANTLNAQKDREAACATAGKHNWSLTSCESDKICLNCNLIAWATEHTYDGENDSVCDVCNQERQLSSNVS